ncbi:shikimate kinase [Fluviicoccus keumensis]|uniref:Shikimate kinase n=1 Tax=Fluviicoccus keumensis TaxID=1435465 RepID=A0A4V2G663_9GAMM|nr:shikimate kinase [Fluviicoccus keumensis]
MRSEGSIFLVGPMGAGKTTIGRFLADMLSWRFIDSDHEIELKTGASIPWIFEKEGEDGFRRREEAMIAELTQQRNVVLATGGGAVMRRANRLALQSRGTVVYLYTPVAMQIDRTAHDRNRPLLQTANPEARLRELFDLRDPLYREIADLIIPTTDGSARELAQKIMQTLGLAPLK